MNLCICLCSTKANIPQWIFEKLKSTDINITINTGGLLAELHRSGFANGPRWDLHYSVESRVYAFIFSFRSAEFWSVLTFCGAHNFAAALQHNMLSVFSHSSAWPFFLRINHSTTMLTHLEEYHHSDWLRHWHHLTLDIISSSKWWCFVWLIVRPMVDLRSALHQYHSLGNHFQFVSFSGCSQEWLAVRFAAERRHLWNVCGLCMCVCVWGNGILHMSRIVSRCSTRRGWSCVVHTLPSVNTFAFVCVYFWKERKLDRWICSHCDGVIVDFLMCGVFMGI